MKDYYAR